MNTISFMAASKGAATLHSNRLWRLRGIFNGTTATAYLMLFDSNGLDAVPANGAVPLIPAIPLFQGSAGSPTQFFESFDISTLGFASGLYWAVSTTQESLTISTDTVDIDFEVVDADAPTGLTLAGNTTSGIDSLAVFTNSISAKIYSLRVTNNGAGTRYLMLFNGTAINGATPIMQWTLAAGATLNLDFGKNGYHPKVGAVATTDDCYLYGSSTSTTLTTTAGGLWRMEALYA